MRLRHQPPAHSPLTAAAIGRGLKAALATGTARQALAALLCGHFAADDVVLTDSGTSALALAIRGALAARPGAAVALPAWSCYDVATAADAAGASVLCYDLDPATLGPDWASLRAALSAGAAAVVAVHAYGVPVDLEAMRREADTAGAVIVEDAAQAVGAALHGHAVATLAARAVLSFGRGKGLTGGGGGALLLRGTASARMARDGLAPGGRGVRALAGAAAQWVLARPSLYGLPASLPFLGLGQSVYRDAHAPRVIGAAEAAIVLAAWEPSFAEVGVRRANAAVLLESVPPAFGRVMAPPGAEPSWLRLPLVAPPAAAAAADRRAAHVLGVYRGYPRPLVDLPGFGGRIRNRENAYPGARTLAERLVTLPTHGHLAPRDREALRAWMHAAVSDR